MPTEALGWSVQHVSEGLRRSLLRQDMVLTVKMTEHCCFEPPLLARTRNPCQPVQCRLDRRLAPVPID